MILPCPRCPKNNEKPSRGEAALGLSAQLPNDIQIGPMLVPKWIQNWSQNGVRHALKFALVFWLSVGPKLGPKLGPKMDSKWLQIWSQNEVSCPDVFLEPQMGSKWSQNVSGSPNMDPKWFQNVTLEREMDTKMAFDPAGGYPKGLQKIHTCIHIHKYVYTLTYT